MYKENPSGREDRVLDLSAEKANKRKEYMVHTQDKMLNLIPAKLHPYDIQFYMQKVY